MSASPSAPYAEGPTAVVRAPKVPLWTAAVFVLFLMRGLLFNTWFSRGPDVQRLLEASTLQLGLIAMLVPVGGLLAIGPAGALVERLGSRLVATAGYILASVPLALAGFAIQSGNLLVSCVLLVLFGAPLAVVDFVGNYEGTLVDKAARRSVFAAIHGAFGLGMLSAAFLTGVVSDAGMSLDTHFGLIALIAMVASVAASLALPRHPRRQRPVEKTAEPRSRAVWFERRSQLIALIGFTFIMAETSAGTWVPIAMTGAGFTPSQAAYALSLFWILMTLGRLLGGFVVDAIGRYRTVLVSCLVTAVGVAGFMAAGDSPLTYVALALWGLGLALGFPMSVASMSDDPAKASARVNMIIMIVYLANLTVGPALGGIGEAFGVYAAFAVPVVLLLVSASLAKVTRPLMGGRPR